MKFLKAQLDHFYDFMTVLLMDYFTGAEVIPGNMIRIICSLSLSLQLPSGRNFEPNVYF